MKLKIKKVQITKSYLCHPKDVKTLSNRQWEVLKRFKKRNNIILLVFSSSVKDGLQENQNKHTKS